MIPLSRGSFDVIVGMDRLSKRKLVIVCHEKVVKILLEGSRKLRVQGERTLGAAKALMNAKVDELKVGDISVMRDFVDVFPEDFSGLPPQLQVEFRIDFVHGATLVAKSPYRLAPLEMQELSEQLQELQDEVLELLRKEKLYAKFTKSEAVKNWEIVKPITSLTERDQKYEWGTEQKEAFQTLKNDLCDASINRMDKILATPSETSKVENAPAEMLRDLDQQMEKRADDGKANVVTDALSRKERVKPRRVRAMAMTIQYGVRGMILTAQSEAFKQENVLAEILHGLDQQMERKGDESLSPVLWAEIGESSLTGPKLVLDMTDKVVLIKEKLKAARDRQKSYADNRCKPLEFEVGDRVMPKVSPWKGVILFGKKGKLAPSLHVPLDEINVDKTLRFVEEPVENSNREVKRLKCSRMVVAKSMNLMVKSWEPEDFLRRRNRDNHDMRRYMIIKSIERDRLHWERNSFEIVEFISFTFGCPRK
ncbi:hypothetical protein Tco_0025154 [Tanacetum coccineum]